MGTGRRQAAVSSTTTLTFVQEEWESYFKDMEEAQEWFHERFSPEEATEWDALDFSPSEAQEWSGFTPEDANEWREFTDPSGATQWDANGFEAYEAKQWHELGCDDNEARQWLDMESMSLSSPDIDDARFAIEKLGDGALEWVSELRRYQSSWEGWEDLDVAGLAKWKEHFEDPETALGYYGEGFRQPKRAADWDEEVGDPTYSAAFKEIGIKDPTLARRWIEAGFSPTRDSESMKRLIKEGTSPEDAGVLKSRRDREIEKQVKARQREEALRETFKTAKNLKTVSPEELPAGRLAAYEKLADLRVFLGVEKYKRPEEIEDEVEAQLRKIKILVHANASSSAEERLESLRTAIFKKRNAPVEKILKDVDKQVRIIRQHLCKLPPDGRDFTLKWTETTHNRKEVEETRRFIASVDDKVLEQAWRSADEIAYHAVDTPRSRTGAELREMIGEEMLKRGKWRKRPGMRPSP